MADIVQLQMERMLPELNILAKFNIFSKDEINSIVKQRRQFEYSIKSKNVTIDDYLRYIQYEIDLEKLLKIRMKKRNFQSKKKTLINKQAGIKRVHSIYRRALRTYSNIVELWEQYINFSLSIGSTKSLSFTFAQVLKLHPLQSKFWIKAAFWEYENNHNIHAARVLFQRALRILTNDENIWIQYLRLELLYRKKLADRLKVTGIDQSVLIPTTKNQIELSDDEDDETLNNEKSNKLEKMNNQTDNVVEGSKFDNNNPFFQGKIASIIFENACLAIPNNFEFIVDMWSIYRQFNNTENLQNELYDYIRNNISPLTSKERGFLSRIPLLSCSLVDNSEEFMKYYLDCKNEFNNDINELPSIEMYEEFSKFFHQLLEKSVDNEISEVIVTDLLNLYKKGENDNLLNCELYKDWINVLISNGELKLVNEIILKSRDKFKDNISLIELHFQIELLNLIRTMKINKNNNNICKSITGNLSEILMNILDEIKEENYLSNVWILLKNYFIISESDFSIVVKYLKKLLIKNPKDINDIKKDALTYSSITFGIKKSRKLFNEIKNFPPTKIELYNKMIELELSQIDTNIQLIRKLFEEATNEKESRNNTDLFIQYIRYELQNNNLDKLQPIYWKAKKMLKDNQSFEREYERLTK